MAPKKAKSKMPVDGVDTTSMSREQLEAFCIRLREELDREREERNFFQLERDKLRTFWEITRQELEESRAQQRNQDRAKDELEEKHQAEIKVYKQKVKHLLYEHQCNLSELKVESMVSLKQAQDDYNAMEQQLLKDKKELKEQIHDLELAHLEQVRQLKIDHSAEVSRIREQLESDAAELEKKYEARLSNQAEEHAMREKMEQAELETRKNQHIVDLTKQHESAFQEMKNYYNDITLNNLALISSLKEQMEELKVNHDRMEKQLSACQAENKKLAEPYKQAQSELGLLRRQLATYEQDKNTLANTKQRLSLVTKELENLRWENDVLELRFEKVEKERDRLHTEFVGAVLDVQQKTGLKGALLEKRMASMRTGVSHENGVSLTNDNTASKPSSSKKTRPATVPVWTSPSSGHPLHPRPVLRGRRKPLTIEDDASRFESRAVRSRFRRPPLSEHSRARWITAFKNSSTRTDRSALADAASSPRCAWLQVSHTDPLKACEPQIKDGWRAKACGQPVSGCRLTTFSGAAQSVQALDLSFNYFSRNYMKHRYYPQILDCVGRRLSPIHSQEHPSDASIHDSSEKSRVPQALPSCQEERSVSKNQTSSVQGALRPLSASRADGRDRAFTRRKTSQETNFACASTDATTCDLSRVFRDFVPLPPRPDLPWVDGVKSRYFSAHASPRRSEMCRRPPTADVQIQTFPNATDADMKRPVRQDVESEKKSTTVDESQCFSSHVLHNPLQHSYSVGRKDRWYAPIIASPKMESFKVSSAFATQTGNCDTAPEYPSSSLRNVEENAHGYAPSMRYSYLRRKSRKEDSRVLSLSPIRHLSISGADGAESVASAQSSPATETPSKLSREDTRASVSSMSTSQPNSMKSLEPKEDRQSDTTLKGLEQIDVDTTEDRKPDFLRSAERRDRVSLKRKFKPTFPRRLKLKLMICSYLHYHDTEGDVNFVHPSVKKKSMDPSQGPSSTGGAESSTDLAESPEWMEGDGSASVRNVLSYESFCCVCQSKMVSLEKSLEGDQICCDECTKNADALLEEWEQAEVQSFNNEFGDLLSNQALEKAGLVGMEDSRDSYNPETVFRLEDKKATTGLAEVSGAEHVCADKMCEFLTTTVDCTFPEVGDNIVTDDEISSKLTDKSFLSELNNNVKKQGGESETEDKFRGVEAQMKTEGNTDGEGAGADTRMVDLEQFELCDAQASSSAASETEFDISGAAASMFSQIIGVDDPVLNSEGTGCLFSETSFLVSPFQEGTFLLKNKSESRRAEDPVVFSLSSVQEAIQSAMKMIDTADSVQSSPLSGVLPVVPPSSRPSVLITPDPPDVFGVPENVQHKTGNASTPELKLESMDGLPAVANAFHASHRTHAATSCNLSQACSLGVPPGTDDLIYTEVPVQPHHSTSSRSRYFSKPKNSLVFYEVSKVKNKTNVQSKSVETGTKVTVRPGNNAAGLEGVYLPSVSTEERRRSVGATANLSGRASYGFHVHRPKKCCIEPKHVLASKAAPPCDSKCEFPGFSVRPQDSRRVLSGRGPSREICPGESGKFRHRSEILNEDDTRSRKDPLNDHSCICMKRGRKCNCNLTKLLHICPLPPPRPQRHNVSSFAWRKPERALMSHEKTETVGQKYEGCSSKKSVTFSQPQKGWTETSEFGGLTRKDSLSLSRMQSMRHAGAFSRLGRPDSYGLLKGGMPSLIEESPSGSSLEEEKISCPQFGGSKSTRVSQAPFASGVAPGRSSSTVPETPPPSPSTSFPSPPSSLRRDRVPRRRTGNVSFCEMQDTAESSRFWPRLVTQRSQPQDDCFDKKS